MRVPSLNLGLILMGSLLLPVSAAAQNEAFYRDQAQRQKAFAVKLIRLPEVRRDLALTSEQGTAIDLLLKDHKERYARLSKQLDTNEMDHGSSFEAAKALDEVDRDAERRVFSALKPEQRDRLRAIQFQALGFEALYEKDLQKKLVVTKEQAKGIDAFRKAHGERMSKELHSMGEKYSAEMLADAVNRLQAEGETTILQILSEAQREQYKVIVGNRLASVTKLTKFGG